MSTIAAIVEGDGEVRAVPLLLRRMAQAHGVHNLHIPVPIRVRRDKFLNQDQEFKSKLVLAALKAGDYGTVLVLLDADDDCPLKLAATVMKRASAVVPHRAVSVVIANKEYEAWFLASIASLAGKRGLKNDLEPPEDAESIRDAKGWLGARMLKGGYHVITDQPAFTALFDMDQAHAASRSMRKMTAAVAAAL